jgi:hypothetical protein
MKSKSKVYLIIFILLELAGPLFFHGFTAAEPLKVTGSVLKNENFIPVAIPEKDRLTLVSTFPLIVEGEPLGIGAIYDDPATERRDDYSELYNREGHLLAVSWFDKFGIERIAKDRGVLEDVGILEGVFVVVLDGDSV